MLYNYRRQFVSFTGKCPYQCNHCYTFCGGYNSYDSGCTVQDVIAKLKDEKFDIVYVSGHKENFVNVDEGLELCEKIYETYNSDIMVTTRNIFSSEQIERFKQLNLRMKINKKDLFFCASIPALYSYKKLEPNPIIPNPYQRIDNFISIFKAGIKTILTLRPLCPDIYIPTQEIIEIIELCKDNTSAVLSSEIVVNDEILYKLKGFPKDFSSCEKPLMPCLKNNLSMKYVNVEKELEIIKKKCEELQLPFFKHSLPAIEFLKKQVE